MTLFLWLIIVLLLIGCSTCKLPDGYELVEDNCQKIRVKCPDDYITGCQWETEDVAIDYALCHNDSHKK